MAGRITRSARAALDPGEMIDHLAAPYQTVEHAPGTDGKATSRPLGSDPTGEALPPTCQPCAPRRCPSRTRHCAPGAAAHWRATVPGEGLGEHGFHDPDQDEDMITPTRHDGGQVRP